MNKKYKTLFHAVENNPKLETIPFELLKTANLITKLDTSNIVDKSKKLISEFKPKKLINRIKKLGWK